MTQSRYPLRLFFGSFAVKDFGTLLHVDAKEIWVLGKLFFCLLAVQSRVRLEWFPDEYRINKRGGVN